METNRLLSGIIVGLLVTWFAEQGVARPSEQAAEKTIRKQLFTNYSRIQRPSTPVNIQLNLVVLNIDDVDPKKEEIGLTVWFRMYWKDSRLKWNSSENDIKSLTLDFEEIWTPDMTLYSAVGAVRDFGLSSQDGLKINLIVYSDGQVFFSQPTSIQSACALNIADFPFDDQNCQLTFGSWTMDSTLLRFDLNNGGVDLTYFVENNMWELLDISPSVRSQMYFSHDDALSTVVYNVTVRRKALFYVVNYIAPSVAISFLSLLLFLIPPEVGKRMEAGINLLLCLSVYLLLVNSKMPKTSTAFPLLTKFYGCAIIILVLAMCCTCLVYAMFFMNSSGLELHHASFFISFKDFILHWLQPLLFSNPCKRSKSDPKRRRSKVHPSDTDLNMKEVDTEKIDSQIQDHEQQATTSLDPPVIITSGSRDSLPRNSITSQENQGGHLKLAKTGSSFELSSSMSSFASLKSDENAVVARNNVSNTAENVVATEEGKKVTFACDSDVFMTGVKRRTTSMSNGGSAVKRTEHTLICTPGSSWFTQSSWDESLAEENGNECENNPGQLNDDNNHMMGVNSDADKNDSDTDDQGTVTDGLVELSSTCDRETRKMANAEQWKKAAMVLDRIFIILLFTSIVVSFLACLLLAPRVRNSFIP